MRNLVCVVALILCLPVAHAGERVPAEQWTMYTDPKEAGYDAEGLEIARQQWEELPSSAFMVVSNGAVVAAWGDVSRRFMCHSVRKSFMSALYGVYWDRGEIELNKTMADLGIDDRGDGLLEAETQARILDLLKARSGVFHPAAYAGRTDSRPRGSEGPGRYFAYNNWDFNTLVTILEQETGGKVFEAFDEHFARPLAMEDWRISDGYYHYEPDKSIHPAYPFRLSARDAARFGLVFARNGLWGEARILSRDWVMRSTAMYSIDDDIAGYGMLWWVFREPRFKQYGMVSALGVGNQMIAVLPDLDLVIVNRANTYEGQRTPMPELLDLIESVLEARQGGPEGEPELVPLATSEPDPRFQPVADQRLERFAGEWSYPPEPLGIPQFTTVTTHVDHGALVAYSEVSGTFREYLQPDGSFIEEDSLERYLPIHDANGSYAGFADADTILMAALLAAGADDSKKAKTFLKLVEGESGVAFETSKSLVDHLRGRSERAEKSLRELVKDEEPDTVEMAVNRAGYALFRGEDVDSAIEVFELNTRLFPDAPNTWDSLGEAQMSSGNNDVALRCFERVIELDPENERAKEMIELITSESGQKQ